MMTRAVKRPVMTETIKKNKRAMIKRKAKVTTRRGEMMRVARKEERKRKKKMEGTIRGRREDKRKRKRKKEMTRSLEMIRKPKIDNLLGHLYNTNKQKMNLKMILSQFIKSTYTTY
jgi:hypothetical protein